MSSENVSGSEAVEPVEAVRAKAVDDQLIDELVGRARCVSSWALPRQPRRNSASSSSAATCARGPPEHGRPLLSNADRILITVIYLRRVCSRKVLVDLLAINAVTIGKVIGEIRALMDAQRMIELLQRCSSSVRTALAIDVMRLGLQRDLRKIRRDFRRATPRSTGARAAARARLWVLSVGVSSWKGLCLMSVVSHGPAPW